MIDLSFYNGKKVFLTGHTGFKGSWLTLLLLDAGAEVTGYALPPGNGLNLFSLIGVENRMRSLIGDVRDFETLKRAVEETQPEIILHLAAQPLVRESYRAPQYTYETNVMGTVNLMECVRLCDTVRSVLNVTTDKVYENAERDTGYREEEKLDGYDPYSNSKSCSELVTHSYTKCFLQSQGIAVSTARAGNVIGGGDFAMDRIIPDCVRSALNGESVIVRNPHSIRPYQHVLDPLYAYLLIAQRQYGDIHVAGCYNVGPDECDCVTTGELVTLFCDAWGDGMRWEDRYDGGPYEARLLKLDCNKLKRTMGWNSVWHLDTAVAKAVEWTKTWRDNGDITDCMRRQMKTFCEGICLRT